METANKGSNCGRNRYVCFGSLADITAAMELVRFVPIAGLRARRVPGRALLHSPLLLASIYAALG